jgi:hypothetical protein
MRANVKDGLWLQMQKRGGKSSVILARKHTARKLGRALHQVSAALNVFGRTAKECEPIAKAL